MAGFGDYTPGEMVGSKKRHWVYARERRGEGGLAMKGILVNYEYLHGVP